MSRRGTRRRATAVVGLLATVMVALLSTVGLAWATPVGPELRAPLGLFAQNLTFSVAAISPMVVTRTGPSTLRVTGTVTNGAEVPITDLIVRFQRGEALTSEDAVAAELTSPSQPTSVISGDWQSFGGEIAAGSSSTFSLSTAITGELAGCLQVSKPGIYPVMANVNGTRTVDGVPSQVRVGELHLLLTVTSVPGSAAATGSGDGIGDGSGDGTAGDSGASRAVPIGVTWPISSVPHRGVGGVFLDDSLADLVAPGGALSTRLDALENAEIPAQNVVLTIDPMLLDELEGMTKGYRVVAPGQQATPLDPSTRTSVVTQTLPTTGSGNPSGTAVGTASSVSTPTSGAGSAAPANSGGESGTTDSGATDIPSTTAPGTEAGTGTSTETSTETGTAIGTEIGTVAGTRGSLAAQFLQRLREVSKDASVIVLPYSDPDVVSLVAAGQSRLLNTLRSKGIEVASRVLGDIRLYPDVAIPPDARADAASITAYRQAGYSSVLLSRDSVTGTLPSSGIGRVAGSGRTSLPTLVGDTVLQPLLAQVLAPTDGTTGAAPLNAAVALLAGRHAQGLSSPVLQLPGSIVDVGGLSQLGGALTALSGDGVTGRLEVSALTTSAPGASTLRPVLPSGASRLPTAYVQAWKDSTRTLATTAGVIGGTAEGRAVTDTLAAALQGTVSASLRSDTSHGAAVITTVQQSLQKITDAVTIKTSAGSYTLASADSPLVLTVQNQLPFPVRIALQVSGGSSAGLQLAVPDSIDVGGKRSTQVPLQASVARAGTFAVNVQLALPGAGGAPWGAAQRIEIRSNAYGSLTFILVIGAGGVLFLMVGLRLWQRLRERRSAAAKPPVASEVRPDSVTAMVEQQAQAPTADGADARASAGSAPQAGDENACSATDPARPDAPSDGADDGSDDDESITAMAARAAKDWE